MSDGYTPGDLSVRIAYVYIDAEHAEDIKQQRGEAFDRWLASVKAEAKAEQAEADAQIAEGFGIIGRNLEPYWEGFDDATEKIAAAIRAAAENGESK